MDINRVNGVNNITPNEKMNPKQQESTFKKELGVGMLGYGTEGRSLVTQTNNKNSVTRTLYQKLKNCKDVCEKERLQELISLASQFDLNDDDSNVNLKHFFEMASENNKVFSNDFYKDFMNILRNKSLLEGLKNHEFTLTDNFTPKRRTQFNEDELIKFEEINEGDFVDLDTLLKYQEQEQEIYKQQKAENSSIESILDTILANETIDKSKKTGLHILSKLSKDDINKSLDIIAGMEKKSLDNVELYSNNNVKDKQKQISSFYKNYDNLLFNLVNTLDKEALDILMRKRIDSFKEYLDDFGKLSPESVDLIKEMANSTTIDKKPFMPTQKVEFINLLSGFERNALDTDKIKEMVASGTIDLAQLHIDLFNKILSNSDLTEEEIQSIPKEKLLTWDTKFAHLLSKEMNNYESKYILSDIIRAASLEDFSEYIQSKTNEYGQINSITKSQFKKMGLNYNKWVNPPKNLETNFTATDHNSEQLIHIENQITEDLNSLMDSRIKGFLKKQFPEYTKEDSFIIPQEIINNKTKLQSFVRQLTNESKHGVLSQVWQRAYKNKISTDPILADRAKKTLTILDHLKQRERDLENVTEETVEKQRNWKIKMWDRNPQHDLFQGNYSTCCIGLGDSNGSAMAHYLMDTAFNMIEIIDNDTGETIGNALCYMIKTENSKPAFVIDNIEINNTVKPSDEVGIQLRNTIADYASNIAKTVTGKDDTPIYVSSAFNDVPTEDLEKHEELISFIGDIDDEQIYLDLYGGWTDRDGLADSVELLKLK